MDVQTDGRTDKIAQVIAVTLRLRFVARVNYSRMCNKETINIDYNTTALRAHTPRAPCICIIVQLGHIYAVDDLYLHVRGQCA